MSINEDYCHGHDEGYELACKQYKPITQRLRNENKELRALLKEVVGVIQECDEYLMPNVRNYIGCGSILHQKLSESAAKATNFLGEGNDG